MAEIKVRMVDINRLIPYENNPRRNEKAVEAVARSIQEFGWQSPIIVDRDFVIISGHTRRLAALSLGLKEVPVYVAEDMTPEQIRAFRLADNRTSEVAYWDEEALREEMQKIRWIDLSGFGFSRDLLEGAVEKEIGVKRHVCPRCGAEWTS